MPPSGGRSRRPASAARPAARLPSVTPRARSAAAATPSPPRRMPSSRCSEPRRGGAERVRLLAGELHGGAGLGGDAQLRGRSSRRAGARSRRRARGSGGARPGGRCRGRGRPRRRSAAVQRLPGLDALEGVQLAAQRGQVVQRDLGVRGVDGVLEQLGDAVRKVYRALQPRSMVTGTPEKAAPPGPARKAIDVRDLVGFDQALDGVWGQDDLLQDVIFAHPVRFRLVGDLRLHQRRAHVARADGGGLQALQRERLHQAEHAVLGGDVRGLVRRGDQRVGAKRPR